MTNGHDQPGAQAQGQNPPASPPPAPQPCYILMQPPVEEDDIHLTDLWQAIIHGRWLIAGITFLSTAIAIGYALLTTPVYRAEVLLAPVGRDSDSQRGLVAAFSQMGGLGNIAGIALPTERDVETAIATLKSRRFLERFIAENNIKPIMFEDRWDPERGAWIDDGGSLIDRVRSALLVKGSIRSRSNEKLLPGEPTGWEAYELFRKSVLSVSKDRRTGLVTVRVEWKDPELAAKWANALVARLNEELRRQAIEKSQRSIRYLQEQIEETSIADLRALLYRLIEEHVKNVTLARTTSEYVFRVIDPAVPPERHVRPRRTLLVLLGAALGLFLGSAYSYVRHGALQCRH